MMIMHGIGMGGWMWLAPTLMLVLFWGGVYLAARAAGTNLRSEERPMDILKKRYANGEINKEEYEEIRREM